MLHNIINSVSHYLGLKKPFKIVIKQKVKGAQAWHTGLYRKNKLIGHKIEVTLDIGDDIRDMETLIVHELIHAWQAENNYLDTHGETFQDMAEDIRGVFGINNLYIPGTDT